MDCLGDAIWLIVCDDHERLIIFIHDHVDACSPFRVLARVGRVVPRRIISIEGFCTRDCLACWKGGWLPPGVSTGINAIFDQLWSPTPLGGAGNARKWIQSAARLIFCLRGDADNFGMANGKVEDGIEGHNFLTVLRLPAQLQTDAHSVRVVNVRGVQAYGHGHIDPFTPITRTARHMGLAGHMACIDESTHVKAEICFGSNRV